MVFWKDSVDFNRIIVKQQDKVDNRGSLSGGTFASSPDRKRAASKKAADDVIREYQNRANADSQANFQGIGQRGGTQVSANYNNRGASAYAR